MLSHYFGAHGGGVEAVAAEMANGLAARALEVTWMAADADSPPPPREGLETRPMSAWNAIERRTGVPFPLWTPRAVTDLHHAVGLHDVVFVHDALYVPNLLAIAAARRAGKPVLLVQHLGDVPYRNPLLHGLVRLGNASAGRWAMRSAQRIVFISPTVERWFLDRRPSLAPRCEVIANGVDTTLYAPRDGTQREEARRQLIGEDRPLCLFVGRFVAKKGIPLLRELARRMPAAVFAFAGTGPLDPTALGTSNVRVLGRLTPAALARWYAAADCLLLPSFGEGFPLVVQEGLACGLPALVGADTAAAFPQFGGALQGLPVTGKPDDLALWHEAINARLAAPTDDAQRFASAALAASLWSWDRSLDRYALLARSLASGSGARP